MASSAADDDLGIISDVELEKLRLHPVTRDFIRVFQRLMPDERAVVLDEVQGYVEGYRTGRDEVMEEALDLDCERPAMDEAAAETLAETMTDANIIPGTKGLPS